MKSAYPFVNQPVSITLISNVPFDNTYKDHPFNHNIFTYDGETIDGSVKISNFIDVKLVPGNVYKYPHYSLAPDTFNFNFTNGLVGKVTLELTPEQTNANYMKVVSGEEEYYYFITSINQLNADTYELTIECDVIMTYGSVFAVSMSENPVMTKRKHCHRYSSNGFVFSPDYKSGDSTFSGVKPSLVKDIIKPTLYIDNLIETSLENPMKFSDILWLYIVTDFDTFDVGTYKGNGSGYIRNPFQVICVPLNAKIKITDTNTLGGQRSVYVGCKEPTIAEEYLFEVKNLIEQGHYKSAKVSPYPPFTTLPAGTILKEDDVGYFEIIGDSNEITVNGDAEGNGYARLVCGNNHLNVSNETTDEPLTKSCFKIRCEYDFEHDFDGVWIEDFTEPAHNINTERVPDTKLLFTPFRKYALTSASGDEQTIYPELLCSLSPFTSYDNTLFKIATIKTAYGGDYTYFTYVKPFNLLNYIVGFKDYKYGKVGLAVTENYTLPVGTNALEVFKATQSETYYQSKIASGISSGLSIAGGIGMIVGGAVLTATGGASPAGIGMIGGGIASFAGGTAGVANTIKSTTAKIEDLKNTPDSINVSGSSYAHDYAMKLNGLLPYIITYECSPVINRSADDWFYHYGYEVSRECYFNYELKFDNEGEDDNNLFGRTIFNYIELQEDITTKIRANIPPIVKQKLSSIFQKGITLWTFFGFGFWSSGIMVSANNYGKWYQQSTLDNTEYKEGE